MKNLFMVMSVDASRHAQRKHTVAEINVLRKFEGRSIIEERIAQNMGKLHNMWFSSSKRELYAKSK